MTDQQALSAPLHKSVENGLTLCYSLPEDIGRLVEFNARLLTGDAACKPVERMIESHL
jgi:hypothetical protein